MEPTIKNTSNSPQDEPVSKRLKETWKEQSFNHLQTECAPLKSVEELHAILDRPPAWLSEIKVREKRSRTVVQNFLSDCHNKCSSHKVKPRFDAKFIPKTLVCHDYKGGYLEDRHLVVEVDKGDQYTFYNWSHIDIFVYFSHHFITIPPLCWINAAHQEGVKILGTIITEFDEGREICNSILANLETMQNFVKNLCKLTEMFKIDGWLLNFENPLDQETAVILKEFVKQLTLQLHAVNPDTLVIWYDSVLESGKLHWQNELNKENSCYFERCDGIFLNYVWTEQNLLNSIELAKERSMDIYVGVDIFGRNTYGGGQFSSYKAAEVIRRHGLSMAIFAPGWTHESIVSSDNDSIGLMEHFFNKDCAFWNSLWPYLYTYSIKDFFHTNFYKGADANRFSLLRQEKQLSKIVHPKFSYLVPNYTDIPTLERKCHCIRLEYENDRALCLINKQGLPTDAIIHNLFVCDIEAVGFIIVYFIKKVKPFGVLSLKLVTSLENGARHVVTLNGRRQKVLRQNSSVTEVNPYPDEIDLVTDLKKQYSVSEEFSDIVVYAFNLSRCNILEIGAILEEGDAVCLEGFGIQPSTSINSESNVDFYFSNEIENENQLGNSFNSAK